MATDAVVAGSPEFLGAVLEPLQARLGGAPRVADTPHLAFALCQDSARLLVFEFRGQEWLPLCEDLRRFAGPGIAIVVALPPEHAGAAAGLSATASAVVAWSGDSRSLLEAVSRVVSQPGAPAARARPAPVLTPLPGGGGPPVARPSAAPAARPAVTPARPPPPVPKPPVRPAPPAVTPVQAVRPVPTAAPARPASPAPAAGGAPAPARAAPPAPTPAGATVRAAVPQAAPAATAPAPIHLVKPDPFAGLFDEPAEGGPPGVEAEAEPAEARPPAPPPVQFLVSNTWPGTVPNATQAEAVLSGALVGLWPEDALRPVTEKVLSDLTPAEKAALKNQPAPLDAAAMRRAAGVRWQVAAALSTVPAPNTPVDQEALRAILAGTDQVLADLKAMSEDANPEALRTIESIRHAVVREAIDLTEAVQRIVPAEVAAEITSSRPVGRGAETRVLFTASGADKYERKKPWGVIVTFVLALGSGAAYHAYRYVNRPRPTPPAVTGAPAGSVAQTTSQGKIMFAHAGKHLDPREVESFKNAEGAKGNEVQEVLPGVFVVTPAGKSAPGTPPAQGAKP